MDTLDTEDENLPEGILVTEERLGIPDTEVEIEQNTETGKVLTANGVNLTPDTEWTEDVQHAYDSILFNHNPIEADKQFGKMLESVLNNLLTSRDTYWKERVRKDVEGMKMVTHRDTCILFRVPMDVASCACAPIAYGHNQALDTLLENLTKVR